MDAKCIISFERILPDGGFKRYDAGVVYDVSDLPEATVKAHFEHPTVAPPKGMQTRTAGGKGESRE